jgi:hypothetical protein
MPGTIRSDTVYKLCAVLGTFIAALAPYISWQYVQNFEDEATAVFERQILTELDLESLNAQFNSLKSAIESGRQSGEDSTDYTPEQIQHMLGDSEALHRRIEQTQTERRRLETAKRNLIGDIKLLFIATVAVTVIGAVAAIAGFLGWYFHVQIFQERRSAPRGDPDPGP